MNHLRELENKSIYIIREAHKKFKKVGVLWSIGKDSTTLLWLCKKAFYGKIPFKVIHIDTGYKFKEIYEFRNKYTKEWDLDLVIAKNEDADKKGITPEKDHFECCNARKTEALKQCIKKHDFEALLLGIRRDEHGIRDKERYFSPRDKQFKWNIVKEKQNKQEGDSDFIAMQDTEFDAWGIYATDFGPENNHVRIHPMLHWTELEIWKYIQKENIPMVSLYLAKNKKRYRSIGCECCCKPVDSESDDINKIVEELKTTKISERTGRVQNKENHDIMQKLRHLGYM
ncbi:MAG: sulfate adenylyltransferase subunit CysD [Nanoarchaeota archaeon]|nr:sulfate adenylyltransferase subunit CysD [Nanoarchaeota archaeon]MBU1269514.1 sulfate adenylyltransferase subunit CysD [Nanoarchaeota archaeon]MBU1604286.1 sulfate adenylyltransferase subunit CysD [Nanoarchaeota archaeon]MBU2443670.1 sulfate adenylyltransferase subunit CysD [Nanoarchaeota archaeon]